MAMVSDIIVGVAIVTWGTVGYVMGYARGRRREMALHANNDVRYVSRGRDDE